MIAGLDCRALPRIGSSTHFARHGARSVEIRVSLMRGQETGGEAEDLLLGCLLGLHEDKRHCNC